MPRKYWVEKTHDGFVVLKAHPDTPIPIAFFDTKDKAKSHILSLELKDFINESGARNDL